MVQKSTPKSAWFFLCITYFILVLFAGLRDSFVGTDTNNYVYYFIHNNNKDIFDNDSRKEIGFAVLNNIISRISSQYWLLLTAIAAIAVYFHLKAIKQLSSNFFISIFLFITLATYLFFFNGARQGIAAAIFGMAIIQVIRGSFIRYLFWIIIASLFHETALIGLPLYYFLRSGFSLKNTLINIVLFSTVLFLVFSTISFSDSSFEKYGAYIDRGALGGGGFTFFYTASILIFMFLRKYILESDIKRYDIYLNLTLIQSLIFLFVFFLKLDVNLMRLNIYFSLGSILIWPILFRNVKGLNSGFAVLVFVVVHLIFFYLALSQAKMDTYILNRAIFT